MLRFPPTKTIGPLTAIFTVWGIAVFSGGWGVDFGFHWDEGMILRWVLWSVEHRTALPPSFLYPSLLHIITLAFLLFQGWIGLVGGTREPFLQQLLEIALSQKFHFSLRLLTVFLSSLAIFWVAMAVWVWRKKPWEAVLAAALLGLSWEVNYHSRWFTVDPLMMQFGALLILCLVQARFSPHPDRWRIAAAVAAGLAAGSKYTAGLCLLPVLAILFFQRPGIKNREFWKEACRLTVVFLVTFLATTPGILWSWGKFYQDLLFQSHTYFQNGWNAYTEGRGFPHFFWMSAYLGGTVFSWSAPVALGFSGLALLGAVDLLKKEKKFAAVFLVFPIAYVALFSVQIVMIVRNLLILIPFGAILATRGATVAYDSLSGPFRKGFAVLLVAAMLTNASWLVHAAWTVRTRARPNQAGLLSQFIERHPRRQFLLSQTSFKALRSLPGPKPTNVTVGFREPSDFTVFNTAEARNRFDGRWKANRPHSVETWMGPYEVNLNYYPTWMGDDRFVVMKTERALNLLLDPRTPRTGAQTDAGPSAQLPQREVGPHP
ncbi:MAG: glycosyltransferase family 39 protein [Elusimicrobia bacterium]|nr:glycosyltransferase family 39 protein [Elusimicrobiota bacterium]